MSRTKGFHHSKDTLRKLSEANKGLIPWNKGKKLDLRSVEWCRNISDAQRGRKQSEKTKDKISNTKKGKKIKPHSAEQCRNLRITTIQRIERNAGQVVPNYNPIACRLIEAYGQEHGYSFQHAENGGEFHIKELGYWVDGYDKDKNVVIEVYEPAHNRRKEKDAQRKNDIVQHLHCTFVILHTT